MNTVKFYLGKRTNDTSKTQIPVVLAFNYASNRLYTQIGIRLTADAWDSKKQRLKSRVSGSLVDIIIKVTQVLSSKLTHPS
jgi:hypothetical protein